jgi:hypothetical protein
MKFLKSILYVISMVCFITACSNEDEELLQRNKDLMDFDYQTSTKDLTILSTGYWKVTTEDDWISVTPNEGNNTGGEKAIQVTVSTNTGAERTGSVLLTDSKHSVSISVQQEDGIFSVDKLSFSAAYIIGKSLVNEKVLIPYHKALTGEKVNVTASLSGTGAEGLSIESLENYALTGGEGSVPLNITGTPVNRSSFKIKVSMTILSTNKVYTFEGDGVCKYENEFAMKLIKATPHLAVVDWGDYEKGTAAFGGNGIPRAYVLELALSENGGAIRKYQNQTNWLSSTSNVNLPTFYEHNRFAFGNLKAGTTYWFRVKVIGGTTSGVLEFTTPAEEPMTDNIILRKDFDNFWFGGCPIYQSFAVQPTEAQISKNLDPDSETTLATDYRTTYPVNNLGNMLSYVNSTTANLSPAKCPALWKFYWDGDTYGTNYGDDDYPGWKGYMALPNTGGVRLGSASVQGYLTTPKLTKIGNGTANILVTIHSAAYFEPYHSWGEDFLQHFVIVEGPGTIVDGGSSAAAPKLSDASCANTDKQITVQCASNVNSATNGPSNSYTVPTEHKITINGATKDTRIMVKTYPYIGSAHYRIFLDDITITKLN